nr:DUF2336 domain-containing protein [Rhizobium sp. L1K21]
MCWVETAKAADRIRAANALGRAYVEDRFDERERRVAEMALACVLDDSNSAVRLSLAKAVASSPKAPRGVILTLCDDQLEIACTIITQSPVLTDDDLVDLAAKGSSAQRVMIASRSRVARPVSAAICEIGRAPEMLQLLQNPGAQLNAAALSRIAARAGDDAEIRNLLLERADLPAAARHMLVEKVSQALASSGLICFAVGNKRAGEVVREARENAMAIVAGAPEQRDLAEFAEHLREKGSLTPAFLMRTLCVGYAEFFAEALANLSGLTSRRVRAILAEGREHAVRALIESAGFARDISPLYVECIMLWRKQGAGPATDINVASALVDWARTKNDLSDSAQSLLDLAEKIGIEQMRLSARQYAARVTDQAA